GDARCPKRDVRGAHRRARSARPRPERRSVAEQAGGRPCPARNRGDAPVISLLAAYLRPYRRQIVVVLGVLLIQAIGNLYLPNLNADIINNGVATGDTNYILRVGALMLVVTALIGVAAVAGVYLGAKVAMGFGRDVGGAIFAKVGGCSRAG